MRGVRSRAALVGALVAVLVAAVSVAATASGRATADDQRRDRREPADAGHRRFDAQAVYGEDRYQREVHDPRRGKLREVTTRDVGSGGKAFDAVMIGMYEAPQFGAAGLLQDLTPMAKSDSAYAYGT
jgi:hypothetical protein